MFRGSTFVLPFFVVGFCIIFVISYIFIYAMYFKGITGGTTYQKPLSIWCYR